MLKEGIHPYLYPGRTAPGFGVAGNALGLEAIDLQSVRTDAAHVASGDTSVICGGSDNAATGNGSVVVGGASNTGIGDNSFVGAGFSNQCVGVSGAIVAGENNTNADDRGFVGAGTTNHNAGLDSAIVSGSNNTNSGDGSAILCGDSNENNGISSAILCGDDGLIDTGGTNAVILGGTGNKTATLNQVVMGTFNALDTDKIFIVGNGANDGARANVFAIDKTTGQWTANGVTGPLKASAVLNFGNTVAGASTDLTIAVAGAVDGDPVSLGVPIASQVADGSFTAFVSAPDTVTVRYSNNNLLTARDPASGTFKVLVFHF